MHVGRLIQFSCISSSKTVCCMWSWTHFTKTLGVHNPHLVNVCYSYIQKWLPKQVTICTCRDMSKFMASQPGSFDLKLKSKLIFVRFNHELKSVCEMGAWGEKTRKKRDANKNFLCRLPLDKVTDFFCRRQFINAFSWMEIFAFSVKFHLNMFDKLLSKICHRYFNSLIWFSLIQLSVKARIIYTMSSLSFSSAKLTSWIIMALTSLRS